MDFKRFTTYTFATIVSVAMIAGCGKSRDEELFGEVDGEGGGTAKIDSATAATITGAVAFEGAAPAPSPLDMSSDGVCAAAGTSAEGAGDVVVTGGKLGNVFVYVSKGLE